MENIEKLKNFCVRAGDRVSTRTGFAFNVAAFDGVRVWPFGASQISFPIGECEILRVASDAEHQAALADMSQSEGLFQEITPERAQMGDISISCIKDSKRSKTTTHMRAGGVIYALQNSKTLSDAQVHAAELWARDYETGVLGARDPEAKAGSGCPDPEYALLSRIAAGTRCRYVQEKLGQTGIKILFMLMIDGLSVSAMASLMEKPRMRVTGSIEMTLDILSEIYSEMPGKLWFTK